jgi:hypothetical protein
MTDLQSVSIKSVKVALTINVALTDIHSFDVNKIILPPAFPPPQPPPGRLGMILRRIRDARGSILAVARLALSLDICIERRLYTSKNPF